MTYLSKSLGGFSSSLKEEVMITKKQGIVSILGCDDVDRTNSVASLKRTLSADMSSKKWQAQQGFYPLKRIASSKELNASVADSSSEEEFEETSKDNEHVWKSIQEDKKNKELEKAGQFDIWSSIISREKQDDSNLLPPYVHPLGRRSASSLSDKSLEICTESLGSETGSDGFSSYPPSETGENIEEDKDMVEQAQVAEKDVHKYDTEDFRVERYNFAAATKKPPPRSFPPPISSLSQSDGVSVHMRSHRDDGRLVLQAVSIPSQRNFHAQRQDGRLVLTFINEEENEQMVEEMNDVDQFDAEIESSEGETECEEEEEEEEEGDTEEESCMELRDNEKGKGEEISYVKERTPKLSTGVMSVHRLALVINKPLVLANMNTNWSDKFNEVVTFEDGEEVFQSVTPLTQSLPPRTPVGRLISTPPAAVATATATATTKAAAGAAASFNPCEYFWKPKPMAASAVPSIFTPITQKLASTTGTNDNSSSNEQEELVVFKGNRGDYYVPLMKGCKEPRRVLFWEPHCIATS